VTTAGYARNVLSDHDDRLRSPRLDVDALLADPEIRIVVCCGAGGVGKTTTAAALALRAAEQHGRRTVVLTIDPARRLAQSLGLTALENTPRQVKGVEADGGDLHAMMLDMKRTFDEVVLAHTDPQKAEEIFANPFYEAMSSTFSGTQEYMAMEKLGQLRARDEWDLIVVDTPPSRSALDFLDAPARLSRFLDGRMLRMLLTPARAGGRSVFKLASASFGLFTRAVTKILGTQLLIDLSTFVNALDSMFGGFRDRAERTYQILQDRETAFLVVAAPEPDAIREAAYFAGRLDTERMPLAGLVLNRVATVSAPEISADTARAAAVRLDGKSGKDGKRGTAGGDGAKDNGVTADTLRIHASLVDQRIRQSSVADRFVSAYPQIPVVEVPAQAADVHDLDGLRAIGRSMSAP
jgi:anion-transporting  ArsA/GET3 family ATPase